MAFTSDIQTHVCISVYSMVTLLFPVMVCLCRYRKISCRLEVGKKYVYTRHYGKLQQHVVLTATQRRKTVLFHWSRAQ